MTGFYMTATLAFNGVENIIEQTFFVTLALKSLYTSVPNHEGVEAAKEALNSVPKKPIATKVIIRFLFLVITLNNLMESITFKN